ncbi:MAG: hypothetical protein AAB725_00235, partial [Patescibacteria group bacterium]
GDIGRVGLGEGKGGAVLPLLIVGQGGKGGKLGGPLGLAGGGGVMGRGGGMAGRGGRVGTVGKSGGGGCILFCELGPKGMIGFLIGVSKGCGLGGESGGGGVNGFTIGLGVGVSAFVISNGLETGVSVLKPSNLGKEGLI